MNWLAHLLLSESDAEFRIGNILADMLRAPELGGLPAGILRGIECHRRIDSFTDSHSTVRCSKQRVSPLFRKFSGILVDIFYDHLLANEWHKHSDVPLNQFITEVYDSIDTLPAEVPAMARFRLEQMRTEDWLSSYGNVDGLRLTLVRVGRRLRKPVDLGIAIADLQADFEAYQNDFSIFFPELRAHVAQQSVEK